MFTRDDTKAVKGAAILLMLLHHLAGFPARWPVGFKGFTNDWLGLGGDALTSVASMAKLCVAIFFFLGGYGLYKRWAASKYSLADAVISLYKQLWKVMAVFVPIAYLFFARSGDGISSLTTRYTVANGAELFDTVVSNMIGYRSTINGEWWFFPAYLCVLPLGYLFCTIPRASDKTRGFVTDMLIVIVIDLLMRTVLPQFSNTTLFKGFSSNFYASRFLQYDLNATTFFAGVACARYNALSDLKARLERLTLRVPVCLAGFVILYACRMRLFNNRADVIVVPLMVAMLSVVIGHLAPVRKVFLFLGRHSTNMWLIHSFYCYYFLEATKLVYITRNVWADLAILTVMTLLSSMLLNAFYSLLGKAWQRIRPSRSGQVAA